MSQAPLFSGDDWVVSITINKNGSPYDVSSASTIEAAVGYIGKSCIGVAIPAVSLSPSATGADWETGVVVCEFPSSSTAGLEDFKQYFIDVQYTIGGNKTTQRNKISVERGIIG
jgi:hypothetical protein